MSEKVSCLWQYPLPHDQQEFRLSVPRGAIVLKLLETESMLGRDFSLLMSVDPTADKGEDIHFQLITIGSAYDPAMVFLGGPIGMGLFLLMDPKRTPHPNDSQD